LEKEEKEGITIKSIGDRETSPLIYAVEPSEKVKNTANIFLPLIKYPP
jgi:hypothetical protein